MWKKLFTNITVFFITPCFDYSTLCDWVKHGDHEKALVLILYGTSNAPVNNERFMNAITLARKKKFEIVVTSQCMRGTSTHYSYKLASMEPLQRLGLISGYDQTIECIVCKLSVLMGKGLRGEPLKEAMEQDLKGELTPKSKWATPYQLVSSTTSSPSLMLSRL